MRCQIPGGEKLNTKQDNSRKTVNLPIEVAIEAASITDLPEIMFLEKNGFAAGIVEDEKVFSQRIATYSDGFLLMRSRSDRKIIGYICSEIWQYSESVNAESFKLNHDISSRHSTSGDELYISSMTILSEFRGTGLGKRLFTECLSRAKKMFPGIKSSILIVNETWTNARRIYLASGFFEIGRIPGFFTPNGLVPQDAIIMRKKMDLPKNRPTAS